MNSELKPKIRFKGFTDDWEQRKLADVGNIVTGTTPPTSDESNYNGDYLFVSPADINMNRYIEKTNTTLSKKGFESGRILNEGSVLFVSIGSTIGKVAQTKEKSTTNQQINAIEVNEKNNNNFIYSLLEKHSNNIRVGASTQAVPILNKTSFSLLEFNMPKIIEQEKIGQLFRQIDNLITLHQRKCDKLVELKKSLLEKMFPQNNSVIPEIRFKGFTNDWEQRKFDTLAKVDRGLTYSPNNLANNGIRVLRSSNINDDQFKLYDEDVFVTPNSINIEYANNNDILITSANGSSRLVGKHTIIKGISSGSTVHGGFMLLARPYINSHFLNASMSSSWYKKFIDLYVAGGNGAIGNLSKTDLDNQIVNIPNESEINKIGDLFKNIDNLITLHQCKYDKLNKIRQSLLNDMFI